MTAPLLQKFIFRVDFLDKMDFLSSFSLLLTSQARYFITVENSTPVTVLSPWVGGLLDSFCLDLSVAGPSSVRTFLMQQLVIHCGHSPWQLGQLY
jgi:hypothetical protein